jgi:hypothetical protein
MGADDAQDRWTATLTEEIEQAARRAHPADAPYAVAARVLGEIGTLLRTRGADDDLVAQLDAAQDYLTSVEGPAPLPQLRARRHDPRPRSDQRWREVRIQLLLSVREDAWREAAGRPPGVPYDVELTHDVANYLTDQLAAAPVIRQAGARFTALPELGPIAGPGIEGPA